MNKAYLNSIRRDTCYPTFRAFVTVATVLAYIVAALLVVAGFISGQDGGILVGIVIAIVIALIAKVGQEVSLMIADIADATIDSGGHRNQSRSPDIVAEIAPPAGSKTSNVTDASLNMGVCPSCDATIALESSSCPKCDAIFGKDSAWAVRPL